MNTLTKKQADMVAFLTSNPGFHRVNNTIAMSLDKRGLVKCASICDACNTTRSAETGSCQCGKNLTTTKWAIA